MIDVKLRMFIPSQAVAIPMGPLTVGFDGDNRSFSYDQGTSRAEIWIDVDNSPLGSAAISVKRMGFGQSARYPGDAVVDVPGQPSWWKALRPGAVPEATATAQATPDNLGATAVLEAADPFGLVKNVHVKLRALGTNPLQAGAPPFDCNLDLLLAATGAPLLTYSLTGAHDGFPAYELYVQQRLIYSHDPVQMGATPLDLLYQGNITVRVPPTVMA